MQAKKQQADPAQEIQEFLRARFKPNFGRNRQRFRTDPVWSRLRELGSELWLDTGNIVEADSLWTREFSALTTNNTLLNKEVQTGRYDGLILESATILSAYPALTEQQRIREIAFILNAWHALRLVEKFDAYVSVEEHTDVAHDIEQSVHYARRFHRVCPQRFIVKIPFTPAGLLATRRVSPEGIPVNHTLGFSARQNYLIASIGQPAYVNVFLGRLNSFIAVNGLGDGRYVGEKATLASQKAVRQLRRKLGIPTRQIGASFRAGAQVGDLAGIDVMTIPPAVAQEFLASTPFLDELVDRTAAAYVPGLKAGIRPEEIALDTLWEIDTALVDAVEALRKQDLDVFTGQMLINFFKDHDCGDLLVSWSDSQIRTSAAEGKIPKVQNWKQALASKTIGLDSLMNLAGLNSFAADQKAMDTRIRQVLAKHK